MQGEPFDSDVKIAMNNAQEYKDFLEFLEEELGFAYLNELRVKFFEKE
jgi:hypothetical protein